MTARERCCIIDEQRLSVTRHGNNLARHRSAALPPRVRERRCSLSSDRSFLGVPTLLARNGLYGSPLIGGSLHCIPFRIGDLHPGRPARLSPRLRIVGSRHALTPQSLLTCSTRTPLRFSCHGPRIRTPVFQLHDPARSAVYPPSLHTKWSTDQLSSGGGSRKDLQPGPRERPRGDGRSQRVASIRKAVNRPSP